MKKFVLTFVVVSRFDPMQIIIAVIARKAKEARHSASKHTIESCPDKHVWLDPKRTSCKGYKTRRTEPGIESIITC